MAETWNMDGEKLLPRVQWTKIKSVDATSNVLGVLVRPIVSF
jgi:hypothetical protein